MRRVYYDVTHLRHVAGCGVASGIQRVDLEFARHFLGDRSDAAPVQYGVAGASLLPDRRALAATIASVRVGAVDEDPISTVEALLDSVAGSGPSRPSRVASLRRHLTAYGRFLTRPSSRDPAAIRPGAIYLNVAQHALAYRLFFAWLKARRDVKGVFFVHDLMPLDYPEFWRPGYRAVFLKGFETLAEVGCAFIVSTEAVKERLARELRRRGRPDVPILARGFPAFKAPLASPPQRWSPAGATPYFVMVGTIEPRKNHLFVLQLWRRLAETGGGVPKLILVGRRGWENEQAVDLLDRCEAIRPHIVEAPVVGDAELRLLVANANALLYPSFDEGFGLPLAEALTVGTPVVASDIPVLHEVAQGRALFLDPLDGPGWLDAIRRLADPDDVLAHRLRDQAALYRAGDRTAYFAAVEGFLDGL